MNIINIVGMVHVITVRIRPYVPKIVLDFVGMGFVAIWKPARIVLGTVVFAPKCPGVAMAFVIMGRVVEHALGIVGTVLIAETVFVTMGRIVEPALGIVGPAHQFVGTVFVTVSKPV